MQTSWIQIQMFPFKIWCAQILHIISSRLSITTFCFPKQNTAFPIFLCSKWKHLESWFRCLESKSGMFEYYIRCVVDFPKQLSVFQSRKHFLWESLFHFWNIWLLRKLCSKCNSKNSSFPLFSTRTDKNCMADFL